VNLAAIKTIRDKIGCKVGWSDHSVSKEVVIASVLKWNAEIIEFHLDIDGFGAEYSSGHCWLPNDIKDVISFLDNCEKSSGSGIKEPCQEEMNERLWRADPSDGLRPFIAIRKTYEG